MCPDCGNPDYPAQEALEMACQECWEDRGARRLDWVVVGGESGTHARPCHLDWIRTVVRDCQVAGTPVFVKQLGHRAEDPANGIAGAGVVLPDVAPTPTLRLRDRKGGDPSEWPHELRVQERPR